MMFFRPAKKTRSSAVSQVLTSVCCIFLFITAIELKVADVWTSIVLLAPVLYYGGKAGIKLYKKINEQNDDSEIEEEADDECDEDEEKIYFKD